MSITNKQEYKNEYCVAAATKIFGDKWSPRILACLINGPLHFCEIQSKITGITPRSLSIKLNKLAGMEIVLREVPKGFLHKSQYSLTKKGLELVPILIAMNKWGVKYKN